MNKSQIMHKRGFTLYELLVVIIIVGIVAAVALPNFSGMQERSLGKEAKANLKLIVEAEKARRLENGTFYQDGATVSNIDAINSNLSITLTNTSWDYSITVSGSVFNATADRRGSGGYYDCQYSIAYNSSSTSNSEEPTAGSACPK